MIRFLLRFIGLLFMAVAFVFLVYDGTRSIAANAIILTTVSEAWTMANATGMVALQRIVEQKGAAWLWDPVALSVFSTPAFAVCGVIGIVLLVLGRKKRPVIGYGR
jgi:hypothetical protein